MFKSRLMLWSLVGVAGVAAILFYQSNAREADGNVRSQRTRVAVFTAHADPFWDIVLAGAREAADQFNAELDIRTPDEGDAGADSQTQQLVKLEVGNYDGIAISPRDPEYQTRLISSLASQLFVVTFDNDAPQSLRHCYVGTNNHSAGSMTAELIRRALPEGGKIAIFVGDNQRQNARDRRNALIAELRGEELEGDPSTENLDEPIEAGKYTIVGTYLDGGDTDKAVANAEQALEDHSDLGCLVALYGYNGPACLEAVKKADKLDSVKIVAFDEHEATLDGIANGEIVGTVVQDPFRYGYEAVRTLTLLNVDSKFSAPVRGAGVILLPCSIVDQENLEEHRERLKSRTLSDA